MPSLLCLQVTSISPRVRTDTGVFTLIHSHGEDGDRGSDGFGGVQSLNNDGRGNDDICCVCRGNQ